jgi:hypothetical protein
LSDCTLSKPIVVPIEKDLNGTILVSGCLKS